MVSDHFSAVAERYAKCRPSYPPELASFLAGLAPGRSLAWDCGTGSGQAALLLAHEFERVVATDPSEAQLRHATPHPRIEYRVALERASGLPSASCDLVTAAQAAHWFDLPAFYEEADRVLRPRGILAVFGYARIEVNSSIDPVVAWFEHERLGPYWPAGREIATSEYRDLPFPYARVPAPSFVMERRWTCDEFAAYLDTWSAAERCRAAEHADPVPEAVDRLRPLWGAGARLVRWPVHLLCGARRER